MSLKKEAVAFDAQILERINNGHIPDLQNVQPCKYFYNNSWRHPEYVKLDQEEQFNLILSAILEHTNDVNPERINILEVGSGPGWLSLELSRKGFNVIGVELSKMNVDVAKATAQKYSNNPENLRYLCGDVFNLTRETFEPFRVVIFCGSLHHFKNPSIVLKHVKQLMAEDGLLLAHEPTRDKVVRNNAIISYLIQALLSLSNGYYKDFKIDTTLNQQIEVLFNQLRYETEAGGKLQSANDNEAGFEDIYNGLKEVFGKVTYEERYGVFHEIIGGLRFNQNENNVIAKFIHDIDKVLVDAGIIEATEYFFKANN